MSLTSDGEIQFDMEHPAVIGAGFDRNIKREYGGLQAYTVVTCVDPYMSNTN